MKVRADFVFTQLTIFGLALKLRNYSFWVPKQNSIVINGHVGRFWLGQLTITYIFSLWKLLKIHHGLKHSPWIYIGLHVLQLCSKLYIMLHLVCFISNIYKQRFSWLVKFSKKLSNEASFPKISKQLLSNNKLVYYLILI